MVVERDSSEFARLSQLGDLLGLSAMEIGQVHSQLAEQAYRSQVQGVSLSHHPQCFESADAFTAQYSGRAVTLRAPWGVGLQRPWGHTAQAQHMLLSGSL